MSQGAIISDHAVLRYLERAYGLNVEAVRAEMIAEAEPALSLAITLGGFAVVSDRGQFCLAGNVVTTFTVKPKKHRRRRYHAEAG